MKWKNLQENKCPQCGKDWAFDLEQQGDLLTHKCGFKISEQRYLEIVNDRTGRYIESHAPGEHY